MPIEPKSIWERWTFWVPMTLAIIGSVTGYRGYKTSQMIAKATLEPKLAIVNLSLKQSPIMRDLASVHFTVVNKGSVNLRDLHIRAEYSMSELFNGEWFDRSLASGFSLAPGEETQSGINLFAIKKSRHAGIGHYVEIMSGKKHLTIEIRVRAIDSNGVSFNACEAFYYIVADERFQRIADCDAVTPRDSSDYFQ